MYKITQDIQYVTCYLVAIVWMSILRHFHAFIEFKVIIISGNRPRTLTKLSHVPLTIL